MHDPFTPGWADAFKAAINADDGYARAAGQWTWPTALVVEPAPEAGIDAATAVVLELDRGTCTAARIVAYEELGDDAADFVLTGPYATWKAIVKGERDPMGALLTGKLRLARGSLSTLALHAGAARALAACAAHVPTRFPDEEGDAPVETFELQVAPPSKAAEPAANAAPPRPSNSNSNSNSIEEDAAEHYTRLFTNAARLTWDPAEIDLSADPADWARIREEYGEEEYAEQIHRLCSLFYEGEESVARTLSPFVGAMSRAGLGLAPELFLASQLYEEARHYDFFRRYFAEVLGDDDTARHMAPAPQAVLIDDLDDVAQRIRHEDDPSRLRTLLVEGVTHYMGVVEAMLARTGYRGAQKALTERGWLPGLQEGFRLIRRDEGRHVAFGIRFIAEAVAREPIHAEVVEATFERHLPKVLETVAAFDFPHPLVDIDDLQRYALGAHRQFMAAAGLGADAPADGGRTGDELAAEVAEA